jgi:hypothetical protein
MGMDGISINHETIDLRYLEQLSDSEQLNLLAYLMKYVRSYLADGKHTISGIAEEVSAIVAEGGFKKICGNSTPGNLAVPRKQEICACLNRYRALKISGI